VLHYFLMEFDTNLCDSKSDFDAFKHMQFELIETNVFALSFVSNIIVSPCTIKHLHILVANGMVDVYSGFEVNFDGELDSNFENNNHVLFDDLKVNMVDLQGINEENACTNLDLEIENEFGKFLEPLKLNDEKSLECTCIGDTCYICFEIHLALTIICDCFVGRKLSKSETQAAFCTMMSNLTQLQLILIVQLLWILIHDGILPSHCQAH